jgi:hypothetical protein
MAFAEPEEAVEAETVDAETEHVTDNVARGERKDDKKKEKKKKKSLLAEQAKQDINETLAKPTPMVNDAAHTTASTDTKKSKKKKKDKDTDDTHVPILARRSINLR